jgi:ATP-dependent helicase HrpA
LNAVGEDRELTEIGRELARLPLDPRIGRMLVAGREERCLEQARIIAARALGAGPARPAGRERPVPPTSATRSSTTSARTSSPGSSCGSCSTANGRRPAARTFLSVPRMREWRDVESQLRKTLEELEWPCLRRASTGRSTARSAPALLGNIGMREEAEGAYLGARGIKFWVHPVRA